MRSSNTHPNAAHPNADVRMRGFAVRSTVQQALAWLDEHCPSTTELMQELISLSDAAGRVLAENVNSTVDVPQFRRAMMDGFALHAENTRGAGSENRLRLEIIGDCFPGEAFAGEVAPGQAVRIMTGAPLPAGADAVLPAERCEFHDSQLFVLDEIAAGKHVGTIGEDITAGTEVFQAGRQLRAQDVGVLSSIGCPAVKVVQRPRVRIVITGNELLPTGTTPAGCQIADANGPMLAALVNRDGGMTSGPDLVPDDRDAILAALKSDAEVILVSGGSSVGQEDYAPTLLAEHGELGIHGIHMRPGSPTGMGTLDGRLVILLPGNPVSCLCAYDFFAGRAIRQLGGRSANWPYRSVQGTVASKLMSPLGRLVYARVAFNPKNSWVEPITNSGSSVLSSTTRADGFVVIPADSEGYDEGTEVGVFLYD
ncbi:molybdopterin molybdotransferase MoeA [Adhaeretor mobilis]|uniref:Molybdopterin molybdenumtransferase n=1 Tax=Adhaeretor mobilis TaxID=1930276 RepID=A0A517MPP7_9BACT|nr:gephyrin-like molybdotransferase Glp [Adhaeretor mobilis]QDS96851.1 Molybdopterin molybdenumtransferase [Adhaeretor mobilis]